MDTKLGKFECEKCGAKFPKSQGLQRHKNRKTPCAPILDIDDLREDDKKNPNKCRFCGRVYGSKGSLQQHVSKYCKIVPRNGDTSGMDKLYEHVLKRQLERERQQRQQHEDEIESLKMRIAKMEEKTAPAVPATTEHKEVKVANIVAGKNATVDQSINKTVNKVTINIFGAEKTPHITPRDVLGLFRSLGPIGSDLGKAGERIILSMAMMIYSDEKHPENITCYLSSKKGKEALVHAESGWEVMPISLTLSPMASRSVDELFKKQPWAGLDGIAVDANLEEPTKILSYIAKNEGDLVGGAAAPSSEFRAIPIRNKEILEKVLAKLPRMGDA